MHTETMAAWVVITGLIRDESFLLGRLDFFFNQKQVGNVAQLIFSTWTGEIEKWPAVKAAIKKYEFVLVESDQPDIKCSGHYIHQVISLRNALEICPDNQFVLRCRTDKCGPESGVIDEEIAAFLTKKSYIKKVKTGSDIFDFKIGTLGYHTNVSNSAPAFFFWHDRCYFGQKEDLLKLINYNALSFSFENLIPEQVFFATIFLQEWPIFKLFFKSANQIEVIHKIFFNKELSDEKLEKLTTFLVSKKLFKYAFLTEKYLLHKYFFDIKTGLDFEFKTKYRDVVVDIGLDEKNIPDFLEINKIKMSDYRQDVQDISEFLEKEFLIKNAKIEEYQGSGFLRYAFTTPPSGVSILNNN